MKYGKSWYQVFESENLGEAHFYAYRCWQQGLHYHPAV